MKLVRLTLFYVSFFQLSLKIKRFSRKLHSGFSAERVISAFFLLPLIVACSSDGTDPVVVDLPLAYIERPLLDEDGDLVPDDAAEPQNFRPGAILYLKQKASVNAQTIDISSAAFSDESFLNDDGELLYDVRDVNSSYDGKKLLFSLRAPEIENADEEDQPTWNIWEYHIENQTLRRIFDSTLNVRAEEGHDISPSYLPDGRILFSSTRQTRSKAILLDEGKTGYAALDENRNVHAFNLHVMEEDGQNIQQLTFNQSHDLDPIVLQNGKILFARWDNAGETPNDGVNLYEINPDGTGLNYLYGRHSHDSGTDGGEVQYLKPKELENGNIAVSLRPFDSDNFAGQPVEIDVENYIEADRELDGTESLEGFAQVAIVNDVSSNGEQTIYGQYGDFIPLYDGTNRYLASWSLCRVSLIDDDPETDGDQTGAPEACTEEKLESEEYEAASPRYGLYVYDATQDTLRLVSEPKDGSRFGQVRLITSRPEPAPFTPIELGNYGEGMGAIHIRSVYDFDGIDTSPEGLTVLANPELTPANQRPQRFLRIEKPVSIPDDNTLDFDTSAFGISRGQSMRQILGYVPIEPDGSVMVTVPADVAFAMSILNEKGQQTSQRHQHWLQVTEGELIECNGCHTANSEVPHGRLGAGPEAVNTGADTSGLPFPGTNPEAPEEGFEFEVEMGQTMAQSYTNNYGIRNLSPDIIYTDEWQTPADEAEEIRLAYEDLQTPKPVTPGCEGEWTSGCRVVINYETHIHPLWGLDRRILDPDEELEIDQAPTVLADYTCTSCHSNTKNVKRLKLDDEGNVELDDEGDEVSETVTEVRVPEAQLDLTSGPSDRNAFHFKSYQELLGDDDRQIIDENDLLVDETEDVLRVDENDEPVLDENGDEIFDERTFPVNPSMDRTGALSSPAFFNRFEDGGTHQGFLSEAELKLLSEWLDLGGQYFNDPFAAPIN